MKKDEFINKAVEVLVETQKKLEVVDKLAIKVDNLENSILRLDNKIDSLDRELKHFRKDVEERFDNLESEVGSMSEALLDVARTVKQHDTDIKQLQAG